MAKFNTPQNLKSVYLDLTEGAPIAAIGKSPAIDLESYPVATLQIVKQGALTNLAADWEVSNVDDDNHYVKYVTGVTHADLTTKDKGLFIAPAGVRFARLNVTAITGTIRVVALAHSQS